VAKKGDQRREAIVAAAARLFWVNGFSATSIADIARAAGVPQGNMFYYFRTKAELAIAVADVFVGETQSLILEAETASPDPRERIRFLLHVLASPTAAVSTMAVRSAAAVRDFRRAAPQASARPGRVSSCLSVSLRGNCRKPVPGLPSPWPGPGGW
jgi:AcrR family transcriptional regulator